MEERRQAPRVSVQETGLTAGIKHILASAFRAPRTASWDSVVDLSTKGACFVTGAKLDAQQELPLMLRIDPQSPPVELRGTVVRLSAPDGSGRRRVGVQFTDYKGDAWSRLRWFEQHHVDNRAPDRREAPEPGDVRKPRGRASESPNRGAKMVQALGADVLQ